MLVQVFHEMLLVDYTDHGLTFACSCISSILRYSSLATGQPTIADTLETASLTAVSTLSFRKTLTMSSSSSLSIGMALVLNPRRPTPFRNHLSMTFSRMQTL